MAVTEARRYLIAPALRNLSIKGILNAGQLGKPLKAFQLILSRPSLLRRRRYIFLLGHQRGYSSVLSHILGSHPQISGYSESWTSYRTALDLFRLRLLVCMHGNYKPGAPFFLDKILHNQLELSPSILARSDIEYLFLLRQPAPTVRSMVALHSSYARQGAGINPAFNPITVDESLDHYRRRVDTLRELGQELARRGRRACFVAGETLIEEPGPVLQNLQAFFNLEAPLHERYLLFPRTGSWRYCDPSEYIRKGKIELRRPDHAEIDIPESETMARANRAWERCVATLASCFPSSSCHSPAAFVAADSR
jgi:hypothetical protein